MRLTGGIPTRQGNITTRPWINVRTHLVLDARYSVQRLYKGELMGWTKKGWVPLTVNSPLLEVDSYRKAQKLKERISLKRKRT